MPRYIVKVYKMYRGRIEIDTHNTYYREWIKWIRK